MGNFISKFIKDMTGQTAAEKANAAQQRGYKEQEARLQPLYDATLPQALRYYDIAAGKVDPMTGRAYSPADNPAFQWRQAQSEKALSRYLRSKGRENSTFGGNAFTDMTNDLTADEYEKGLGRLAGLEGMARGYTGSLNTLSGNRANSTADMELGKGAIKNQLFMAGLKGLGAAIGGYFGGAGGAAAGGNALSGNYTDSGSLFSQKKQWTPWED